MLKWKVKSNYFINYKCDAVKITFASKKCRNEVW